MTNYTSCFNLDTLRGKLSEERTAFYFPFSGNFYGQALPGSLMLYNGVLLVIFSHLPEFRHLFTNSSVIPLSKSEKSKE